jgi:hypothetical protein
VSLEDPTYEPAHGGDGAAFVPGWGVAANDSLINDVEFPAAEPTPEGRDHLYTRSLRTYEIDGTKIAAEFQIYFSP